MRRSTQTGSSSLSGGAHQWTDYHRELLCVLSRFLKERGQNDSHTRLVRGNQILWKIISHEVGRSGTEGFTESAPRAYLHSMQVSNHHIWKAVFVDTDFSDAAGRWQTHRQQLTEAAATFGVRLVPRTSDHRLHAEHIRLARERAHAQGALDLGQVADVSVTRRSQQSTDDAILVGDDVYATPSGQASQPVEDSYDGYSYARQVANAVAFRFFTPRSHSINAMVDGEFVALAGQWVSGIRDPPPRSSPDFLESAYAHLRPLPQPSPFLSVTTSFFFALRRLLRESDASLAVIRMDNLVHEGDPPSRLTRACGIIAKLKNFKGVLRQSVDAETSTGNFLVGKEYLYDPNTEFIVWGQIFSDAILHVISRNDMEQFLRNNPSVDNILHISELVRFEKPSQASIFLKSLRIKLTRRTGAAVGILAALLGLGQGHLERFAFNILRRWGIGTHKSARQKGKHSCNINESAYLRGFLDGWDIMATGLKRSPGSDETTQIQSPVIIDLTAMDDEEVEDDEAVDIIPEARSTEIETEEDEEFQFIDDLGTELLENSLDSSDTDDPALGTDSPQVQIDTQVDDRRWTIVPSAEFVASQWRAEKAMAEEMARI